MPDVPAASGPDTDEIALVGALLDAQREVVVLVRLEHRPASEVAAILGVPEGTVKSRMRLARSKIRELVATDPRFVSLRGRMEENSRMEDGNG